MKVKISPSNLSSNQKWTKQKIIYTFCFLIFFMSFFQFQIVGKCVNEVKSSLLSQNAKLISNVRKYLEERVAREVFSGTILIAYGTTPIFLDSYGHAEKGFKVPNSMETKYNLGSITKIFTSVSICQLAQAGKLSFQDPIVNY